MDFSRFTDPNAYKQALAGLLRRGGEVTDFIATAPEKAGQAILEGHEKNKALQAQAFANPNRPFQVTNQQAMTELGDRMLAGPLSVAPVGMIAYHGTPHTILDKFDINKVGTGEGAQSYGHGMYFAEAPAVAKQYQAALSDTKYKVGERELKGNEAWAAQFLHNFQGDALPKRVDVDTAISKANETLKDTPTKQEIINNIKALDKAGLSVENGNLYKVDIPDEYIPKMLDYDKPIKDQPEILGKVRALIKDPDMLKTFDHNVESGITGANVYANYIPTGVSRFDLLKQRDDLLNKYMTKDMGMSDAVRAMNPDDRFAFSEIAQKIDDLKNKPKMVSKILNDIGIKGIRYLDEGSRIAPKYKGDPAFIYAGKDFKENGYTLEEAFEGMKKAYKNEDFKELKDALGEVYGVKPNQTSNFVVFDPSTVKILERNNQPISRKELLQQQIDKIE